MKPSPESVRGNLAADISWLGLLLNLVCLHVVVLAIEQYEIGKLP